MFRVQMAELGHPVIGPASFWKLTPAEVRLYAEGFHQREQRSGRGGAGGAGGDGVPQQYGGQVDPSYDVESKRRRDDELLQRMDRKVREHEGAIG